MKLPTYEFLIDDNDESDGVKVISIVTTPAMQSKFLVFNNKKLKSKYVFVEKDEKEYKGIVAGLSLIPNKLIFRINEETGEEYNAYFSTETIEKIRDRYHRQMMTSNVNLEHNEDAFIDAYLIESYIIDTEEMLSAVKAKGIEEAVIGAWFTAIKVDNEIAFNACVDGTFTGFSIEAFLETELKNMNAIINNNKLNTQKKMKKNLIERIKERVNIVLSKIDFTEALVPELGFIITYGEVGEEVTKTYTNSDDEEVTEPVGNGDFVIESGETIIVDDNSMLVEVIAKPDEAPADEEMVDEEDKPADEEVPVVEEEDKEKLAVVEDVVDEVVEDVVDVVDEVVEDSPTLPEEVKAWLLKVAGDFEDGDVYLSVYKQGGEFVWGSVSTYADIKMSQTIKTEMSTQESNITKLNAEIADLKTKLSKPISEPVLRESEVKLSNLKEITLYERLALRSKLPVV